MNGVGNDETGVLVLGTSSRPRSVSLTVAGATNIPVRPSVPDAGSDPGQWALDVAIKRRFEKRIMMHVAQLHARC